MRRIDFKWDLVKPRSLGKISSLDEAANALSTRHLHRDGIACSARSIDV